MWRRPRLQLDPTFQDCYVFFWFFECFVLASSCCLIELQWHCFRFEHILRNVKSGPGPERLPAVLSVRHTPTPRRRKRKSEVLQSQVPEDPVEAGTAGSSNGPESDAACQEGSYPSGPQTVEEARKWHLHQVRSILCTEEAVERFVSNMSGLTITTHYSGSGCPEIALKYLQAALKQVHGRELNYPVRLYSAADISKQCQSFLASHLGEHTHIFGDQLQRFMSGPKFFSTKQHVHIILYSTCLHARTA